MGVLIRPAFATEAETLSDLALRSKAHWGYDTAFLGACRDELTVGAHEMESRRAKGAALCPAATARSSVFTH
ncbi:hypothetical protein [Streptomyces sp. CA-132043]|uniref:hypothetical protein n=1 Tax=Streptomyces sp. CA-132043 TaxID=3240048 RepID=UPI003D925C3D